MACDQSEKISLLIDGELTATEVRSLELHLARCEECNQVRADFLGLRSQISAYSPLLAPSKPGPALAAVLAKPSRERQAGWLGRFLGLGDALPVARYATIAALLMIGVAIGTIALLRYQPPTEIANNKSTPAADVVNPTAALPDSLDQLASNSGRKPSKGKPREATPNQRKPDSKIKRSKEQGTPKPLPQLQNSAPPTYAFVNEPDDPAATRSGDTDALTASHLEQSELLLRAFRNLRPNRSGRITEVAYERRRAQQLLYRNIMLRREADSEGDVEVSSLLGSLEPILLDIANLRDKPRRGDVETIKERVERTSIVPLLQVNSMAVARANE
jgi:hypothetical protein